MQRRLNVKKRELHVIPETSESHNELVSYLRSEISSLKSENKDLESRLLSSEKSLLKTQTLLSTTKGDHSKIVSELRSTKSKLSTTKGNHSKIVSELRSTKSKLSTIKGDNQKLSSELSTIKSKSTHALTISRDDIDKLKTVLESSMKKENSKLLSKLKELTKVSDAARELRQDIAGQRIRKRTKRKR